MSQHVIVVEIVSIFAMRDLSHGFVVNRCLREQCGELDVWLGKLPRALPQRSQQSDRSFVLAGALTRAQQYTQAIAL